MNAKHLTAFASAAALAFAAAGVARADDAPAAAPAGPTALSTPAMSSSLSSNADPLSIDGGPLGKIYVSGQFSGLIGTTHEPFAGNKKTKADLSNAQLEIQKTDGVVQFYVQAGLYNFPSLGAANLQSPRITEDTFKYVPVAYLKIAPNSAFNVEIGKLPTLIGAEYTFTFQNVNIARGLLWNQEPAISRGVQANYTQGPVTASVALTDGFYSDRYSTLSGLLSYTATMKDTIAFAGSAQLDKTNKTSFATPIAQNNGTVWNLMWTHTDGPWVINPYLQYTTTPKEVKFGLPSSASTFGGAVLAKYSFTPNFNLAGRVEYETSSGSQVALLYGPKSDAWSFTLTPTFQWKTYFVRGEFSYTKIGSGSAGSEFGRFGNKEQQERLMVETGVLF